jgi:hypothetical protein
MASSYSSDDDDNDDAPDPRRTLAPIPEEVVRVKFCFISCRFLSNFLTFLVYRRRRSSHQHNSRMRRKKNRMRREKKKVTVAVLATMMAHHREQVTKKKQCCRSDRRGPVETSMPKSLSPKRNVQQLPIR